MTLEVVGSFEIAKLELHKGDSLVVKTEMVLSTDQAKYIKQHFAPCVPDGVEVIVLGRGLTLEVLQAKERIA